MVGNRRVQTHLLQIWPRGTIPIDPDPDPLRVFDEVDVTHNPFRFVVYIMWLRQQPCAFDWFCRLLTQHEELVRGTMMKLSSNI